MAKSFRACFRHIFLPRNAILRSFSSTSYNSSSTVVDDVNNKSFAEMFEETPFAKLGRPAGKVVEGKITHIVKDDMYVDFGWKFHAVVKIPPSKVKSQSFSVGDVIEVKINELEMTGHFLGQHKRITLCEADVSLVDEKS
ncbi:28S ribosomal protein S28, mitochondrial-like [Dendronephthya gigantea]|uniref:28S ribosomal protein S28, mitochondrial-like n=1 Tax=Dendronephthya gigantea TaxID=151771 RepID=UPI00106BBCE8|nr:28S ribosomal protein S28, mitochondrial-like [Dendronephthya gigantea]